MTRALVVYESMFGNTRAVATAIAEGLARTLEVRLVEAGAAPPTLDDVELLVVGAPTHAFGMPRPSTRADAAKHGTGPGVGAERGVREWLARLGPQPGLPAAAFSTLAEKPAWLSVIGGAGRGIETGLTRLGCDLVAPQGRFRVQGMTGPLAPGELARAAAWGEELARLASGRPWRAFGATRSELTPGS